jgi:hypothetical protein
MILRPDPPEEEELEDERYRYAHSDICPSTRKPQIYMDSYTPDI